jgi:hypothetical protein
MTQQQQANSKAIHADWLRRKVTNAICERGFAGNLLSSRLSLSALA